MFLKNLFYVKTFSLKIYLMFTFWFLTFLPAHSSGFVEPVQPECNDCLVLFRQNLPEIKNEEVNQKNCQKLSLDQDVNFCQIISLNKKNILKAISDGPLHSPLVNTLFVGLTHFSNANILLDKTKEYEYSLLLFGAILLRNREVSKNFIQRFWLKHENDLAFPGLPKNPTSSELQQDNQSEDYEVLPVILFGPSQNSTNIPFDSNLGTSLTSSSENKINTSPCIIETNTEESLSNSGNEQFKEAYFQSLYATFINSFLGRQISDGVKRGATLSCFYISAKLVEKYLDKAGAQMLPGFLYPKESRGWGSVISKALTSGMIVPLSMFTGPEKVYISSYYVKVARKTLEALTTGYFQNIRKHNVKQFNSVAAPYLFVCFTGAILIKQEDFKFLNFSQFPGKVMHFVGKINLKVPVYMFGKFLEEYMRPKIGSNLTVRLLSGVFMSAVLSLAEDPSNIIADILEKSWSNLSLEVFMSFFDSHPYYTMSTYIMIFSYHLFI